MTLTKYLRVRVFFVSFFSPPYVGWPLDVMFHYNYMH